MIRWLKDWLPILSIVFFTLALAVAYVLWLERNTDREFRTIDRMFTGTDRAAGGFFDSGYEYTTYFAHNNEGFTCRITSVDYQLLKVGDKITCVSGWK